MALRPAERTAFLVIRLWVEDDGSGGLRARITRTLDVGERDELTTVVSNPDEITRVVCEWLDAFVATSGVTEL